MFFKLLTFEKQTQNLIPSYVLHLLSMITNKNKSLNISRKKFSSLKIIIIIL